MRAELRGFKIPWKEARKYGVGYYPKGFWVKPQEESRFGSILFPMQDWDGNIVNIMAKDIGLDNKIDLPNSIHIAWQKPYGLFHAEGFLNEVVHIYMNPTEGLQAIASGQENSVVAYDAFDFPSITITSEVFLHPVEGRSIDKIVELLSNECIKIQSINAGANPKGFR